MLQKRSKTRSPPGQVNRTAARRARPRTRAEPGGRAAHLLPPASWCPFCRPRPRARRGSAARSFAAQTPCAARQTKTMGFTGASCAGSPARAWAGTQRAHSLHPGRIALSRGALPAAARREPGPAPGAARGASAGSGTRQAPASRGLRAPAAHHWHPEPAGHPEPATLAEPAAAVREGHRAPLALALASLASATLSLFVARTTF